MQVPAPCAHCRGSGHRLTVPFRCPRYLEMTFLTLVVCPVCRGDGRADPSAPSDTELVRAWELGGGFRVPLEARSEFHVRSGETAMASHHWTRHGARFDAASTEHPV